MKYDRLIYKSNRCYHLEATLNVKFKIAPMSTTPIIKEFSNYVILKKKKTSKFEFIFAKLNKETQDDALVNDPKSKRSLDIAQVFVVAFYRLNSRVYRRQGVRCFSLTIATIIEELVRKLIIVDLDCVELKALIKITLEKVLKKLSIKYHDLKAAFDRVKVNDLSSHRLYDHKIQLKDNDKLMSKSRIY